MRHKDENKTQAIFQATIELLNEIGFQDLSISKIAKRAKVSPATIYIYFENKEDMLGKLYLRVKEKISSRMFHGLDQTTSLKDEFNLILKNYAKFILGNKDDFLFIEQFTNSPSIDKLVLDQGQSLFQPVFNLFEEGKKQYVFKQTSTNLLITFSFTPINDVVKQHFKNDFVLNEQSLDSIIKMSWDAVKA